MFGWYANRAKLRIKGEGSAGCDTLFNDAQRITESSKIGVAFAQLSNGDSSFWAI